MLLMMTEKAAGEVARKTLGLGSLGWQSVLSLSMCLSVNESKRESRLHVWDRSLYGMFK